MGGFNPQSSGMNRVRAHRRYGVNLQPLRLAGRRHDPADAHLHALPPHAREGGVVVDARHPGKLSPDRRDAVDSRSHLVAELAKPRSADAHDQPQLVAVRPVRQRPTEAALTAPRSPGAVLAQPLDAVAAGAPSSGLPATRQASLSSQMVMGPSLTSSTSISAPKIATTDGDAARLDGAREDLDELGGQAPARPRR